MRIDNVFSQSKPQRFKRITNTTEENIPDSFETQRSVHAQII